MGRDELSEELLPTVIRKGEVRNPMGYNNWVQRWRNKDFQRLLQADANEPCGEPGFEHLTNAQFASKLLWAKAKTGDLRWFKELMNRLFGRVPLNVDMSVSPIPTDLSELTDAQLAERLDALRDLMVGPAQQSLPEVIDVTDPRADAVCVDDDADDHLP